MAFMLPEQVESFKTEGEGRFYRFLATVAKPDHSYLAWYTPDLQGKEPDFILYSDSVGLIVFEVKDWALHQIREADPSRFTLDINGVATARKNPLQQARDYIGDLKDKIKADGRLVSNDPAHHGNPRIPIHHAVVFPNIGKFEYTEKNLHAVIPAEKIFFADELHPASEMCCDPSGRCFLKALSERFPPVFRFRPLPGDFQHLKHLIFPQVRIELPNREGDASYTAQAARLKTLDHNQEALARQFDGGHRIITGPSGSGKTLVLAHKAAFLQRYNPAIKSILFVCYNITLVSYIKRILADKGVPFGDAGVTVCHFYELCAMILEQAVAFEKEEPAYYEMVAQEALARLEAYGRKYDAVLVDEGQDFTPEMFKVVAGLLNPATNNLTITLDDNQNIYRPKAQWKALGIQARGRVHKLPGAYRNTAEIAGFAARFIGAPAPEDSTPDPQRKLFEGYCDFHGAQPELCRYETLDGLVAGVAEQAAAAIKTEGCPASEVAVLFALKRPDRSRPESLPEMLESALEKQGVLSQWMSESYRSKKAYDITTNRVTISTIHSAKGLDYAVVFLLGLEHLTPRGWTEDQIASLVYVGITRARFQLVIPCTNRTPLIEKLERVLNAPV